MLYPFLHDPYTLASISHSFYLSRMSYSFAFDDTPQVLNLFSEWLCWCMLWAGIKVYSLISRKKTPYVRGDDFEEESTSLAFFIVTSSVCASLVEVNWILVCPQLSFNLLLRL